MSILYHCNDGRSFRPLWAIEELGLDCDLRILPFPPRLTSPDYLKENPLGTIPLLIDGDTRMRESAMIGHYLAIREGSDLAVAPTEADYGRYLDGLAYGETTLTWPQAVTFLYSIFAAEADRLPRVVDDMKVRLGIVFADLDRMLGRREWIAADRFTMADISIGYAIRLSKYVDVFDGLSDNLRAYFERLSARPGYRSAEARQGSV
jgi:glutathione S-transferase